MSSFKIITGQPHEVIVSVSGLSGNKLKSQQARSFYIVFNLYRRTALVKSYACTLNVEKASDAMSNVDTSTYLKKLKKSSA